MLHLKAKSNSLAKLRSFWDSLDGSAIVNKRELVLGLSTCFLSGVVIGILFSPKKSMTIGSHNGCYNTGSVSPEKAPEEEPGHEE